MRLKLLPLLIFCFFSPFSFAVTNGLSFDLNHGIGYTLFAGQYWGGISLNAFQQRFGDNQMVVSPRVYANYNVCNTEPVSFFVGGTYTDDFGLRSDTNDKHRVLALTLGITSKVSEKLRLSTWVNGWGVRDDLIYNKNTGKREFDTNANRQSFMDFGGLLITYLF